MQAHFVNSVIDVPHEDVVVTAGEDNTQKGGSTTSSCYHSILMRDIDT